MATACEAEYTLPKGYMHTLWDASMRDDPAARATIVLCSAANIRLHQTNPFRQVFLLRFRGHTLSRIRTALGDPSRRTSDALLVAVTSMAISERLSGREEDYNVHMRALAQIRKFRGATIGKMLDGILSSSGSLKTSQMLDWTSAAYK